jgi:hypothetical protein
MKEKFRNCPVSVLYLPVEKGLSLCVNQVDICMKVIVAAQHQAELRQRVAFVKQQVRSMDFPRFTETKEGLYKFANAHGALVFVGYYACSLFANLISSKRLVAMLVRLARITRFLCQPFFRFSELADLQEDINNYIREFHFECGLQETVIALHYLSHVPTLLRRHGPALSMSTFDCER